MEASKQTKQSTLRSRYDALKKEAPGVRAYDAAERLGCSEMELLALGLGEQVTRVDARDWEGFFNELHPDTRFMSLVRNQAGVHEFTTGLKENRYRESRREFVIGGSFRFVLIKSVKLSAFAAVHEGGRMPPRSLQVFDGFGRAVWKLYVKSRLKEFDQAVRVFSANGDFREPDVLADATPSTAFNTEKHGCVSVESYRTILEYAVSKQWPVSVSVENSTCLQSYTGIVGKTVPMEGWFNILDARFNLHLREPLVESAWSAPDVRNRLAVSYLNSAQQPVLTLSLATDAGAEVTDAWHKLIYEELSK